MKRIIKFLKLQQWFYILFVITLIITGCGKSEEINLIYIESLIFNNTTNVWLALDQSSSRELDLNEIITLKTAIKNGSELTEISNDLMPKPFFKSGNAVFDIKWRNRYSANIVYEKESGCLYIYKDQIPWKNISRYMNNRYMREKYLTGVLKFKPSPNINELVLKN